MSTILVALLVSQPLMFPLKCARAVTLPRAQRASRGQPALTSASSVRVRSQVLCAARSASLAGSAFSLASVHTPYEAIPYEVSYGVGHTGSLRASTNFMRASKSSINLH